MSYLGEKVCSFLKRHERTLEFDRLVNAPMKEGTICAVGHWNPIAVLVRSQGVEGDADVVPVSVARDTADSIFAGFTIWKPTEDERLGNLNKLRTHTGAPQFGVVSKSIYQSELSALSFLLVVSRLAWLHFFLCSSSAFYSLRSRVFPRWKDLGWE